MITSLKEFFSRLNEFIFGQSSDEISDLDKIFQESNPESQDRSTFQSEEQWETLYVAPSDDWSLRHNTTEGIFETETSKSESSGEDKRLEEFKDERAEQSDINEKEEVSASLLEDLVGLISEMDTVKAKLGSEESKEIIQFCQERIIECMKNQSLEEIVDTQFFDSEIHIPQPFQIVAKGTPIKSCLRAGLRYKGKILLKAIVDVSTD